MPICPNCESEYIEGIEVCPDCGYELVEKKQFEEHMIDPEDWISIFETSERYEAQMLKSNLDGAGIESLIIDQKDRNFPAMGDFSLIRLVVKKDDEETARQIIQDIEFNNPSSDEQ